MRGPHLDPNKPGERAVIGVRERWGACLKRAGISANEAIGRSAERNGEHGILITLGGGAAFFSPSSDPDAPRPDNRIARSALAEVAREHPDCTAS